MTLYQRLIKAGIEIAGHAGDLQFPDTSESRAVLSEFPDKKAEPFMNQVTKTIWLEVPFSYDPYWLELEEKCERKRQRQLNRS